MRRAKACDLISSDIPAGTNECQQAFRAIPRNAEYSDSSTSTSGKKYLAVVHDRNGIQLVDALFEFIQFAYPLNEA